MVAKIYALNSVLVTLAFGEIRARGSPTLPVLWGAFLTYQVVRVSEFGLRILWNQRHPQSVRRKREIWPLMYRWAVKRLRRQRREDPIVDVDVVWTSAYTYEARKYSSMDYAV